MRSPSESESIGDDKAQPSSCCVLTGLAVENSVLLSVPSRANGAVIILLPCGNRTRADLMVVGTMYDFSVSE